jgi:hypothetical protein
MTPKVLYDEKAGRVVLVCQGNRGDDFLVTLTPNEARRLGCRMMVLGVGNMTVPSKQERG